jgi:hypothetical protein
LIVTVTPGSAPPELSVTVPKIDPVTPCCARAGAAANVTINSAMSAKHPRW